MTQAGSPSPAHPPSDVEPVMFILRSALANVDKLGPATLQAILARLDVSNPLMPDKVGFIKGTFVMLLADFGAGWFTINNVTTNRLQALALALGLNASDDRAQVFNALQAFALANQNSSAPLRVPPDVIEDSPVTPTTPVTSPPRQSKPAAKFKVFSWGGHRSQAIAMPTEPGVGRARPVLKKSTSSTQIGAPQSVGRQQVEQLNTEFSANHITREQYDAEFSKLMGEIRSRKVGERHGVPDSPSKAGLTLDAPAVSAPRFVRANASVANSSVVHPAFGPDVTEPPPADYSPGYIALNQDFPDPCPYLCKGSTQQPPGPRLNEHPPQPFVEPPTYGQPGVPEMPPPPPPRMMDYTAPPLKSGLTFSPPEGETVTKYTYSFAANRWYKRRIRVRLDRYPFQEGTMRHVFFMKDLSQPEGSAQTYVAKISKDANDPLESYFKDCEMQALAGHYAEEFCQFGVPKHAQYVDAAVIECHDRQPTRPGGKVLFSIEPLVVGAFIKYTNNYGWSNQEIPRHTPQAFAHFSWCFSQGTLLVADVQGVVDNVGVDRYTDPQVLSVSGPPFGRADMQLEGIRKFFETHQCNDVCRKLGLPEGMQFARPYVPPPRRPLLSPGVVDEELLKLVATPGKPQSPQKTPRYRHLPHPPLPAPTPPKPVYTSSHPEKFVVAPATPPPPVRTATSITLPVPTVPSGFGLSASYIVQGYQSPAPSSIQPSHLSTQGHRRPISLPHQQYLPLHGAAAGPQATAVSVAHGPPRLLGGSGAGFGGATPLRSPTPFTAFYPSSFR